MKRKACTLQRSFIPALMLNLQHRTVRFGMSPAWSAMRVHLLLWVAILAGCTPQPEPREESAPRDTVMVHQTGDWIPVPASHLDLPQFPFTSRIPAEVFEVDEADSGEGSALRLSAGFGGIATSEAYALLYFATPVHATDGSARTSLLALFEALDVTPEHDPPVPPCLWAEETFFFRSLREDIEGYACMAQKDGIPFYLYVQYPNPLADGMNATSMCSSGTGAGVQMVRPSNCLLHNVCQSWNFAPFLRKT